MGGPVKFDAIKGGGELGTDLTGEMAQRIKDVIYDYVGKVSLPSAIGVLRIVEREILDSQ